MYKYFILVLLKLFVLLGLSDPYVKFKSCGRLIHKSKTVYKNLNPTWDETFTHLLDDALEPIQIKVRIKYELFNI